MIKVYFFLLIINLISGYARAQVPQADMRIGSLNNVQRHNYSTNENNSLKSLNLDKYNVIASLEGAISPDQYILGPGDELGISIIMGENLTLPIKITPTGDIFIPSVGLVNVSGLTLNNARKRVKAFIIENAYPSAKVNIALLNIRKFQIQVVGAVRKPGFIEISALDRLDKIILEAEGFHPLAIEYDILVFRNNGQKEKINFLNFIRDGDLKQNPTFLEGDIIKIAFGDLSSNSVALRGQVENSGYDIIEEKETLSQFLNRSIDLNNESNLKSIIVTRSSGKTEQIFSIQPNNFSTFILSNGDIIDIAREDGIMVNGFVQNPGAYSYVPGYSVFNYISMAGGSTKDGSIKKIKILHSDGRNSKNPGAELKRGDVIIVERSTINTLAGNMSILQIVASVLTIYMTYLSSQNR
ncbi:MAG: polysaccharide biosynthesis/export family protein [Candidatus Neomarinimicrobiota bacterium]